MKELNDSQKIYCECIMFKDANGNQGALPVFQTELAACADVALPKRLVIPAKSSVKEDLLIGFNIPYNMKIMMYPRSSLLTKYGLMQPTSIIDADYSGKHVHVPLYNPTESEIILEQGTRVAQIECVPRYDSSSWGRKHSTREGGFGSTGK